MDTEAPKESSPWPFVLAMAGGAAARWLLFRKRAKTPSDAPEAEFIESGQPESTLPASDVTEPLFRGPTASPSGWQGKSVFVHADMTPVQGNDAASSSALVDTVPDPLTARQHILLEEQRGKDAASEQRYADAESYFLRAAQLGLSGANFKSIDLKEVAINFYSAGSYAWSAKHEATAIKSMTAALEAIREMIKDLDPSYGYDAEQELRKCRTIEATCLCSLGEYRRLQASGSAGDGGADRRQAESLLREAVSIAKDVNQTELAAMALKEMGYIAIEDERPELAVLYLERALDVAQSGGHGWLMVAAHSALACVFYDAGDQQRAHFQCREALSVRRRHPASDYDRGYAVYEGKAARILADIAIDDGDVELAKKWLEGAAQSFDHANYPTDADEAREAAAQLTEPLEDDEAAD